MNKTLYEIAQEYIDIYNELLDSGGEITDELGEKLEINAENKKVKFENYAKLIKTLEGKLKIRNDEVERLNSLNQSDQKVIDSLRTRLEYTMKLFEEDNFETSLFRFSLRKSEAIIIEDETLIPEKFIKKVTKIVESISKTDIKNFLKENEGNKVPGAVLEKRKKLVIK